MKTVDGQFYLFNDFNQRLTFFTLLDITMIFMWLLIIYFVSFYIRSKHSDKIHYKYYLSNVTFRLFFSILFSLTYVFLYSGGDSVFYWDGAACLNRLFYYDPFTYIAELFTTPFEGDYKDPFNKITGHPSYVIMFEDESYMVVKIASIFTFFTFNSYIAINLIIAFIAALYSWKLFEVLRKIIPHDDRLLVFALFFIPSTAFWCSSISKDAFVYISITIIIIHIFRLIHKLYTFKLLSLFYILLHSYLVFKIRPVILLCLVVAILVMLGLKVAKKYNSYPYFKYFLQFTIVLSSISLLFIVLNQINAEETIANYLKEAEIIQQDFKQNVTYTGKKYVIEVTDYSIGGLILAMPASLFAGLYRPLIYEALTPQFIINGIESTVYLYLSIIFFRRNVKYKFQTIAKHEFYLFSFIFFMILAFVTGFTSILFGVLIRLRAPLLPFFLLILTIKKKEIYSNEKGQQL